MRVVRLELQGPGVTDSGMLDGSSRDAGSPTVSIAARGEHMWSLWVKLM